MNSEWVGIVLLSVSKVLFLHAACSFLVPFFTCCMFFCILFCSLVVVACCLCLLYSPILLGGGISSLQFCMPLAIVSCVLLHVNVALPFVCTWCKLYLVVGDFSCDFVMGNFACLCVSPTVLHHY